MNFELLDLQKYKLQITFPQYNNIICRSRSAAYTALFAVELLHFHLCAESIIAIRCSANLINRRE